MQMQLIRQFLRNAASTKALTNGNVAGMAKTQAFDATAKRGTTLIADFIQEQAKPLAKNDRNRSNDKSYIFPKVNANIYKGLFRPSILRQVTLLRPLDVFLSSLQKSLSQKREANQLRLNGRHASQSLPAGTERTENYQPIDMASVLKGDNSPLMKAIASGKQAEREQALKLIARDYEEIRHYRGDYHSGRDINTPNRDGLTPLHIAVEKSDPKIVKALLTVPEKNITSPIAHPEMFYAKVFKIPTEARDARGVTPMQIALQKDDHQMVDALINNGVKTIPYMPTNNDLELAGQYLKRAMEASKKSGDASPEFHKRMSKVAASVIRTLIKPGSLNPNVTSPTFADQFSNLLKSNPVAQQDIGKQITSDNRVKQALTKIGVDLTPCRKEPTLPENRQARWDEADFPRVFTSPARRQSHEGRQTNGSPQREWRDHVQPSRSDSQFYNTVQFSSPPPRGR